MSYSLPCERIELTSHTHTKKKSKERKKKRLIVHIYFRLHIFFRFRFLSNYRSLPTIYVSHNFNLKMNVLTTKIFSISSPFPSCYSLPTLVSFSASGGDDRRCRLVQEPWQERDEDAQPCPSRRPLD